MAELSQPNRFLTDSEVRARVEASRARRRERAEAAQNLSPYQKAVRFGGGLAAAAVLAAGIGAGGKAAGQYVYNKLFAGPQLERKLTEPIGEVKSDLRAGEIDRDDVSVITITNPDTTWGAASSLTAGEHPIQPVSDIIVAQQGDRVGLGDKVVLPKDDIEQPAQPQK